MSHDNVQRLYCVDRNCSALALQRIVQQVQVHLADVLDVDAENAVLALAGQRHLQLDTVAADRQVLLRVHVLATIEHRSFWKDFRVNFDHCLDDLAVDLARALVRTDRHVVVVEEASRHGDLKVVRTQRQRSAFGTLVRSLRASEHRDVIAAHRFALQAVATAGAGRIRRLNGGLRRSGRTIVAAGGRLAAAAVRVRLQLIGAAQIHVAAGRRIRQVGQVGCTVVRAGRIGGADHVVAVR